MTSATAWACTAHTLVRRADRRQVMPWLDFFFLAAAGLLAMRPLAQVWSSDPDYAFGWAVPLLAAYLFLERWRDRPAQLQVRCSIPIFVLLLTGGGLAFLLGRMLLQTVPDWRPGLWFCAGLYVAAVITWCWFQGGSTWARHFLFPVAFLWLSVPWLYNLEFPVVQGLMRWNAALVADSLVLMDIPARAAGNTLLVPTGQLGIEEACSGIRSLQASLMMGFFLGEYYRFTCPRRSLLLALSVLLALAGNYGRLLFLAWSGVRRGISSVPALHDSAAGGILCLTILGLWTVCLVLRKMETPARGDLRPSLASIDFMYEDSFATRRWALGLFLAVLMSEAFTQGWFAWRESTAPRAAAWTVRWPSNLPGYTETPISAATHELLRDERSRAGTWTDGRGWRWSALWFAYPPRAANRIASDLHNPEVCLAGAGYRETQDDGPFAFRKGRVALPVHAYLFSSGDESTYVFWIASLDREIENGSAAPGQVIYSQTSSAFVARLLLWTDDAWRGVRQVGSQTLEVSIARAPDYPQARRAFTDFAHATIIPEQPCRAPGITP